MREFETAYLVDALLRSNGNIAHAAAASGNPRWVFFELIREHGLKAGECVEPAPSNSKESMPNRA